jgi:hypothetical protein
VLFAPWQQVMFNAAVDDAVRDLIGRAAIARAPVEAVAASRAEAPDEVTNELNATQSPLNSRRLNDLISLLFTIRRYKIIQAQHLGALPICWVSRATSVSGRKRRNCHGALPLRSSPCGFAL